MDAGKLIGFFIRFLALALGSGILSAQSADIDLPELLLTNVPFSATVNSAGTDFDPGDLMLEIAGEKFGPPEVADDALVFDKLVVQESGTVVVAASLSGERIAERRSRAVSGFWSVLPPLIAIAIALIFRSVMPALFLGAWVGSWVISGLSFSGLGQGLLAVFQVYVRNAVANPDHAAIMLFSFMIGGMVGIVSKNGGMRGVVDLISAWANNARRGQVTTALLGIAIFFDDYANTLVVGNTMRRVTDALRISRAKLAFLVDATAAPIVCVAVVTTWVGYEVGLIDGAVARLDGIDEAPYLIYIKSIGYSFYPLLMLVFVFAVATTGRDFGAMYQAEKRARETGDLHGQSAVLEEMEAEGRELEPGDGVPNRAVNAALPVAVLIISVLTGLAVTGSGDTVTEIIGSADSYTALMWASLIAVLTAATLTIAQRILSLEQTVKAWFSGVKMMLFAMIILVLAWSLGEITDHLHTADYLVSLLGDFLPVAAVPAIIFVLAAMTAFATGTSWGTMGILFPIVVPLVWAILNANNMAEPAHMHIMYSSIACVLTGSVWGDHCSPISDTTILSSMASGCDHIEHVATQLPYALFVGAVALLGGTLPAAFGIPWWLLLVVGSAVVITALRFFGKPVD